jgi:hypothetical protein
MEMSVVPTILVASQLAKKLFERVRRQENNFKFYIRDIGSEGAEWIQMAQYSSQDEKLPLW